MFNEEFTQEDMIHLQKLLRDSNQTITTAESCTGGLVAHLITKISGSSDIFNGGIVSYSNEIKSQELDVKKETLENFGAVSTEVVEEMLKGSLVKFSASYAIAISGVAGPTGGTQKKPVGTVVIGISDKNSHSMVATHHFLGNREQVQEQAAITSLKEIYKFIRKTLDK